MPFSLYLLIHTKEPMGLYAFIMRDCKHARVGIQIHYINFFLLFLIVDSPECENLERLWRSYISEIPVSYVQRFL